MKKAFLAGTALGTVSALAAAGAMAAEAPTWKLTGNANFQFYYVNQDFVAFSQTTSTTTTDVLSKTITWSTTSAYKNTTSGGTQIQDQAQKFFGHHGPGKGGPFVQMQKHPNQHETLVVQIGE